VRNIGEFNDDAEFGENYPGDDDSAESDDDYGE
jgi:hypothetical protein